MQYVTVKDLEALGVREPTEQEIHAALQYLLEYRRANPNAALEQTVIKMTADRILAERGAK